MNRVADAVPNDAWVIEVVFVVGMLSGSFGLFKGAQWLTKLEER